MKAMQIDWNQKTDMTAVLQTPEYHALDDVAKIDIIGDAIFMLNEEYVKLLGNTQDKYGKELQHD
jgi:hypothetical protein